MIRSLTFAAIVTRNRNRDLESELAEKGYQRCTDESPYVYEPKPKRRPGPALPYHDLDVYEAIEMKGKLPSETRVVHSNKLKRK